MINASLERAEEPMRFQHLLNKLVKFVIFSIFTSSNRASSTLFLPTFDAGLAKGCVATVALNRVLEYLEAEGANKMVIVFTVIIRS